MLVKLLTATDGDSSESEQTSAQCATDDRKGQLTTGQSFTVARAKGLQAGSAAPTARSNKARRARRARGGSQKSSPTTSPKPTADQQLLGTTFSSPVLLASGTCGFGEPVVNVISPGEIGGIVTKSVTLKARQGNPAPRLAEFPQGMLNSVGLANPGAEAVRTQKLPWIRQNLGELPVLISVAGATASEIAAVVRTLDEEDGFLGYELNLSCPNDSHRDGLPFCLDHSAMREVIARVRSITSRPLLAKLAPNDPDIATTAAVAAELGADAITAINTIPGFLAGNQGADRTSRLGAGAGGVSGPALLPVGLAAVRKIAQAVSIPVIGVGGILSTDDALAYLQAGASLVQIGTASFADPRCGARVAKGLASRLATGTQPPQIAQKPTRSGPAKTSSNYIERHPPQPQPQ